MCTRENTKNLCFFLAALILGAALALAFTAFAPDKPTLSRADILGIVNKITPDASQLEKLARQVAHDEVAEQLATRGLDADQIDQTIEKAIIAFIKSRATDVGQPSAAPKPQPQVDVAPIDAVTEPVAGNADARYQLIVFSDYECPFCKRFWPTVQTLIDDYGDNLAVTMRDYPLPFHGRAAQREAVAAKCAFKIAGNNAFWAYTDMIYARTASNGQGISGAAPLVALAKEAGIDADAFAQCLNGDSQVKRSVEDDMAAARAAGIRGTPTSILLDTQTGRTAMIRGAQPLSTITSALDTLLGQPGQAQ